MKTRKKDDSGISGVFMVISCNGYFFMLFLIRYKRGTKGHWCHVLNNKMEKKKNKENIFKVSKSGIKQGNDWLNSCQRLFYCNLLHFCCQWMTWDML